MYKATIYNYIKDQKPITVIDNTLDGVKHKAYLVSKDHIAEFIDIIYEDDEGYLDKDEVFITEDGSVEFL